MKKIYMVMLLVVAVLFSCTLSTDAASVTVYAGKGVEVYADASSKWYTGDAGGVNVTFARETVGTVNYTFNRTSSGWNYDISSNAPSYASATTIVKAILKYVRTGEVTIEYNPS